MNLIPGATFTAAQDFRRARRKAAVQEIMARLTGKSIGLLSFEDVRHKLKAHGVGARQLKEIPLDAIVGSVGRYNDFTRDFLPISDSSEYRWVKVKNAFMSMRGVPPIEVFQISDVYFVLDGNHRVSVARELGSTHIQAYVTELKTKVPLTLDVDPDDLIIKARYAEFLERTHLDELRPGADLSVTVPGKYRQLEEHIQVHRYFLGLDQKREIPYQEAVASWYDHVYMPVVRVIRSHGLLKDFPNRTETDLYLWILEHRAALAADLGWDVDTEAAASDLADQYGESGKGLVSRLGEKLLDAVLPDELDPGPPPGQWRRRKQRVESTSLLADRLFTDLLVPVGGDQEGWHALDQAIVIALQEGARLNGLHIVASKAKKSKPETDMLRREFDRRCQTARVPGKLAVVVGEISQQICYRARLSDLIVLNIAHPPGSQPLSRLGSGFSALIRRCPRPILAVPGKSTQLKNALLAFDGSPKGEEALFLAAYLAGRWGISLVVVTVFEDSSVTDSTTLQARQYLEKNGVSARFVQKRGSVAEAILETAEQHGSDLLIMGGYGASPVVEVVLGSTVDHVLRALRYPMLICR